jgi:hypothetical protein
MRMGNHELLLGERAARAHVVVQKAHEQVRTARSDVKKIETLRHHLVTGERAAFERQDRVNQDEIAANRVRQSAKASKASEK